MRFRTNLPKRATLLVGALALVGAGSLTLAAQSAYAFVGVEVGPLHVGVGGDEPPAVVDVAPTAPPPPRVETIPPPPSAVMVWEPGHWNWNGNDWEWDSGHYAERPRPSAAWVPGNWTQQADGRWTWVPGHWS